MDKAEAKIALLKLLKGAYSGELAAALAYKGHADAVRNPVEWAEIIVIYEDELHHRVRLSQMIAELGGEVNLSLERVMKVIGTVFGGLCRLGKWIPGGWFVSMYGAGRLESNNTAEYEHAARYAWLSGNDHLVGELLAFAEKEWDHEKYFREKTLSHVLSSVVPMWKPLPEKSEIRASFEAFMSSNSGKVAEEIVTW